ncbi:MAG TPA: metallophosphoesterase [Cytophagales bacterium]|nr:metallophosphoesterase [Cytophagales bacterium]
MMIQFASDLHLEFSANRNFLDRNPIVPKAEVLVLAGDIVPYARLELASTFLQRVSGQFTTIYWLAGNHEYYGGDIAAWPESSLLPNNVIPVRQLSVALGHTRLIIATLWSKIAPAAAFMIERGINDFHQIRVGPRPLTVADFNTLHQQDLAFIREELTKAGGPAVVVTHHVPTLVNYPAAYRGSALNPAFASRAAEELGPLAPAFWIYGHHHHFVSPFRVGSTTFLTNQLGYVDRGEHRNFKPDKVLQFA